MTHAIFNKKPTQLLVILSFITLIVFSPNIRLITYISLHDAHRIIELALLSLVLLDAVVMGVFQPSKAIRINHPLRFSLFALFTLAALSCYFSINPRHGMIELSIFIALSFMSLFIAGQLIANKRTFIKHLCIVLWASISLYLIGTYTGYFTALITGRTLTWPEPFHGFTVIRAFSQYQLVTIALICLPLLAFNLDRKKQSWIYIALTCWWMLLFYGAARGAVLAWLAAMIVTGVIYKKTAWPLLRIQLINFITGLIGYLLLFKAAPQLMAPASSSAPAVVARTMIRSSTDDRIALWKAALVMIRDYPVFGVGPMQSYFHSSLAKGTHPHNSVLHFASEWGLPATLFITLIVGYCFFCWFKLFNPNKLQSAPKFDQHLAITLFFSVIASGAYSLVSGVTIMTFSQVIVFVIIGLMAGHYVENSANDFKLTKKLHFRPILALIVLITLIISTLPELQLGLTKNRSLAHGQVRFSLTPDTIAPRIWMQQHRPKDWLEQLKNKD